MLPDLKNVHFIAIGGSVMHQLAIMLHERGVKVTGSDDEVFEPSRTTLKEHGLLPEKEGWFPEKITSETEVVILGMHAREDNPELKKAQELNLPIYSFPEFIFQNSKDKQRIVIAGSHGKTTITAIIIHVLDYFNRKFDYIIGARPNGLDQSIRISDAPVIIIEGDEYPSSAIEDSPKFLNYHHHICLISGISWDHMNKYPVEDDYVNQFDLLADNTPKGGSIVYCEEDPMASVLGNKDREDVLRFDYNTHKYETRDGRTFLKNGEESIEVNLHGRHNMQNISGAKIVLNRVGITDEMFFEAIKEFRSPRSRMELVFDKDFTLFKDFAHAPSKVKATVSAVKETFPDKDLVACLELHTFSSLNKDFLGNYKGAADMADNFLVYFNPESVAGKNLPPLKEEDIINSFQKDGLKVFTSSEQLVDHLKEKDLKGKILLMMSSGVFGGVDYESLAESLVT